MVKERNELDKLQEITQKIKNSGEKTSGIVYIS